MDTRKSPTAFFIVGMGSFGLIYGVDEELINKCARNPKTTEWSIAEEYNHHVAIHQALTSHSCEESPVDVRVPTPHYLGHFWGNASPPVDYLHAQRIPSVPEAVREEIVRRYCPTEGQQDALDLSANRENALLRIYMGKISRSRDFRRRFFTLKNFHLTLDKIQELELDTRYLAKQLGRAMGLVHWKARRCARDVEFVLGGSATGEGTVMIAGQPLQIWLLDFKQCREITFDQEGVKKCIESYMHNDPYFPRPPTGAMLLCEDEPLEPCLWEAFSDGYLKEGRSMAVPEECGGAGMSCDDRRRMLLGLMHDVVVGIFDAWQEREKEQAANAAKWAKEEEATKTSCSAPCCEGVNTLSSLVHRFKD